MRGALLLIVGLAACQNAPGSTGGGDDAPMVDAPGSGSGSGAGGTDPFAVSTTNIVLEIDYESGKEPYTGNVVGSGPIWEPMLTNLDRLFAGKKTLTIPTTTTEMENVGAINDEELTVADIAALAAMHRDQHDTADTKTYWMIFVSGHFADETGPKTSVLGISIGDTVAMFKDVIASTGSGLNTSTPRFVEQSTMIHELAHSIGLVDNGVPMVAPHKDSAHGPHCTNPDCVQYWLNEGAADARDFALRRILTGDTILFDAACLADVDALTGGP